LSTGWRDWNGCVRTMVIPIHKLPVGSFTFFQCLTGTELLNLSGTPEIRSQKVIPPYGLEDPLNINRWLVFYCWK
jgi:hypothetical protein